MTDTWTIFGAGQYFIVEIIDAIEARGDNIAVFVHDENTFSEAGPLFSSATRKISIEQFNPATDKYFFGFVSPRKKKLLERLAGFGLNFSNLAHPFSFVSPRAQIGSGNFIGPGSVVGPLARLGDFNILNRTASVGHHTVIGDFNHVGPGATIAGRCRIGDANFFGAGSTVIHDLDIGSEITLGAGAVAVSSLTERGTFVGVPAVRLR